jgi:CubicO group peptidase (beta-lactamase class C family)
VRWTRWGAVALVGVLLAGCSLDDGESEDSFVVVDPGDGGSTGDDTPMTALEPPVEGTEEQLAASDALLADIGSEGPGCAAAVAVGFDQPWLGDAGLANLETGDEIHAETVFDIGSTSKPFTATVVLLLAERGELDLDAPLSDVLDDLPDWADDVTLDQLLHHTAGVPDYVELLYDEGYEDDDTTTDEDALDALGEVEELDFEPGEQFSYSNSGYFLAAEAVEEVTGEDFATVVEDELFQPYDLFAVVDPLFDDPLKATSYVADGDEWEVADSVWEQVGDGGIQTSPTELVRWASELWDPLIGEDVVDARLEAVVDDGEGAGYGAGIVVEEDEDLGTVLSHSGAWAGFVTDLAVVPDQQLAAAVSCNTPDLVDPTDVAYELLEIWAPAD